MLFSFKNKNGGGWVPKRSDGFEGRQKSAEEEFDAEQGRFPFLNPSQNQVEPNRTQQRQSTNDNNNNEFFVFTQKTVIFATIKLSEGFLFFFAGKLAEWKKSVHYY